jgi:hypothetical protein
MGGSFKPSIYTSIRYGHPCAQGLFAAFIINEDGGPIRDLVTGNELAFNGAGARVNSRLGQSLDCQGNDAGGVTTAWQRLKDYGGNMISILWRGTINSSPTPGANLAGVTYTNSDSSPYASYLLDFGSTTQYRVAWNNGGSHAFMLANPATAWDGSERQVVGVIRGTGLPSGIRILEGPNAVALNEGTSNTAPAYTANSRIGIGVYQPSIGRDSKSICKHVYFFDRNVEQGHAQQLYVEPYAFIGPYRRHFAMPASAAVTAWRRTLGELGTRTGARQGM